MDASISRVGGGTGRHDRSNTSNCKWFAEFPLPGEVVPAPGWFGGTWVPVICVALLMFSFAVGDDVGTWSRHTHESQCLATGLVPNPP